MGERLEAIGDDRQEVSPPSPSSLAPRLPWYVIKTKPKKEAVVVNQLGRVDMEVFCPQIRRMSGVRGQGLGVRKKYSSLSSLTPNTLTSKPLFPSYLFVRSNLRDPHIHQLVQYTRGVSHVLRDTEGPQPIAPHIIEAIREKTRDGSLIEQNLLFKEGDKVTAKRGILKDLIGIIEKNLSDLGRVKILFKWLNTSMRATVKYTEVERVG